MRTMLFGSLVSMMLLALPASAHHGWSGNQGEMELSGTVETPLSLSGPHATMQLRDSEGQIWDLTLAPAPRTHRAGLREDTLPAGAAVTVVGQRNNDPARLEAKIRRVTFEGKNYDVYEPRRY